PVDRSPLPLDGGQGIPGIELDSGERRRSGHSPSGDRLPNLGEVDQARRLPVEYEAMIVAPRRFDILPDALGFPEIEGAARRADRFSGRNQSGPDGEVGRAGKGQLVIEDRAGAFSP